MATSLIGCLAAFLLAPLPPPPAAAIMMDPRNLPKGYEPQVKSHLIIVSAEHPGNPVRSVGSRTYKGRQLIVSGENEDRVKGAGPPIKVSRHVLYLDNVRIQRDRATVEISDNFRHGSSGSTYRLRRTAKGWVVLPFDNVWVE